MIEDALSGEEGVVVVGDAREEDLLWATGYFNANLVLVQASRLELPDIYLRLMYAFPHLSLVTISADGRSASVYRLHRRVYEDVSLRRLVEVIRAPANTASGGR
jgi:hypothetical protein